MTKQYWVGDFFIDLSRNQISQNGHVQTLPPKALQVLTYLAEHQGKVVSYDELLDAIWANAVVTPNTLQRSIAQLRKALGENSKSQGILKTHAKQGYSLECEVKWQGDNDDNAIENSEDNLIITSTKSHNIATDKISDITPPNEVQATSGDSSATGISKTPYWIAGLVLVLTAILFFSFRQPTELKLTFGEHRYVTATDDKEYGATYSPDGKYILFQRYDNKVCISDFWAKNTETLEEFRLTSESGTYDIHSLSDNNKTLTFIKKEDCTTPVTQHTCYKLMQLDFQQALLQPQPPQELLQCMDSAIDQPVWIDERHIVMLQKENRTWRLIKFDMENAGSSDLYEIEDGSIMYYTYSAQRDLLAAIILQGNGEQTIDIITPQGELINRFPIVVPEGKPRQLKLELTFVPDTKYLIFGFGSLYYSLSEQGDIQELELPFEAGISGLSFAPQGDKMLMINGRFDSDIARLALPTQAMSPQNTAQEHAGFQVFERSIEQEDNAKFQPDGNGVAFVSAQTGIPQVWLSNDNGTRAISDFPRGSIIRAIQWGENSKSLLVLANWQLNLLQMDGELTSFAIEYPVTQLFHWDSEQQLALAKIIENGISKLVEIDLASQQFKTVTEKTVYYAVKSKNSTVIFKDQMQRFWQTGTMEDSVIEALHNQGSSKQFVIYEQWLYGINDDNQLWSYHLQSEQFKILFKVNPDIDVLTDVNNNELLATLLVSEKFEVIEHDLSHQNP